MLLKAPVDLKLEFLPVVLGLLALSYAYTLNSKYQISTHGCYDTTGYLSYFAIYVYIPIITGLVILSLFRPNSTQYRVALTLIAFFGLFSLAILLRTFYVCRSLKTQTAVNTHANIHPYSVLLKRAYSKTMRQNVFQLASYLETLNTAGTYVQSKSNTVVHATRQRLIEYNEAKATQRGFRLGDFHIAASQHTAVINDSYVSTTMIEAVIIGGARFLDFSVFGAVIDGTMEPVISLADRNGTPGLKNMLSIRDVFQVIGKTRDFVRDPGGFPVDPFFIHLRLYTNDLVVLDKIAHAFLDEFSSHILDVRYSYAQAKLVNTPIVHLLNRVVLVTSSKFAKTGTNSLQGTSLFELVNAQLDDPSQKDSLVHVQWSDATDGSDETLEKRNKSRVAVVFPSYKSGGAFGSSGSNVYAYPVLQKGTHIVAMNYAKTDNALTDYLKFFSPCSFALRHEIVRSPPSTKVVDVIDTLGCQDDPNWLVAPSVVTGDSTDGQINRGCAWVADMPEIRCLAQSASGATAKEMCPVACNTCSSETPQPLKQKRTSKKCHQLKPKKHIQPITPFEINVQ